MRALDRKSVLVGHFAGFCRSPRDRRQPGRSASRCQCSGVAPHRFQLRRVALVDLAERRRYSAGLVADTTEGLLVGAQLGGVVGMCLVESIGGGEVAEHPVHIAEAHHRLSTFVHPRIPNSLISELFGVLVSEDPDYGGWHK
jgi:hypothetical protein